MAYYSSLFLFICICGACFTKALNNGFSMELIHRDSLKSPFFNPTQTQFQKVYNVVNRSIKRANYLNNAFPSTPGNTPSTTITPIEGEYLMSYSIGTPPFKAYGIVDTASSIVWLQCKPCENCYNQTSPIFDPLKSSTYKTIPCASAKCDSLVPYSGCFPKQQNCIYIIRYGDTSKSLGDFSVETLMLESTNSSLTSFPNIVIGCGHINTGTFQKETSGIVGLGGGVGSLITQLDSSIGGKFSYCLVPVFLESNSSSKLKFGNAAVVSGQGTVSTPLLPGSGKERFYNVVLEAFSVGGNRIEFGGSSQTIKEGNILIDSGSTLTFLPSDVYSRLESAVENLVRLKRVKDPTQQLSLCYETTSKQLDVPIITAHFSGADVQLHALNTFMPRSNGVMCFAFASSGSGIGSIFGNLAQQNLLVGFDLHKNIISFKPTDCTKE